MPKLPLNDDNLRQTGRANAHIYIAVFRNGDTTPIGNVIDISTTGMAVVTRTNPDGGALALQLEAEHEDGHKQLCELEAEIVWRRAHKRPGLYLVGFRFLSLSPKARLRIKAIISALATA